MAGHPHGLFSWTDISLPDPEKGARFYSELFGWKAAEQHDPEGNYIYTMFSKDGEDVAGMGKQMPEEAAAGHPSMWMSYISVDDVDGCISAIEDNGGSTVMAPMDVMASGRMAVFTDPQGAVAALWQAGEHKGAGLFNTHGAMTWNELATRDSAAAREFWGAVFGWEFEHFPGAEPAEYWMIKLPTRDSDDPYNGGVITMDESWPAQIPSHWMVYFNVSDTDAAVARLEELGGTVSVPPFDTAAGRIAVVGDDQGGTFSIIAPPTEG